MSETKSKRTCGRCRFGRDQGEGLRCVKDPPRFDRETGEAIRPRVQETDGCCWFRAIGEENIPMDREGNADTDHEGDACVAPTRGRKRDVGSNAGDVAIDRRLRGLIPIYTNAAGDYCKIPLTRGHFAKVDPEDYGWLTQFRWHYVRTGRTFYAARAYDAAARRLHGEFACLNFPQEAEDGQ